MTPPLELVAQDAAAHEAAQALLPWYATRTLGREEAARVESHLAGCPACRADLRSERSFMLAQRTLATPDDAGRGFDALRLQIDTPRRCRRLPLQRWLRRFSDAAPWVRVALGAQFVLVLALAAALVATRPQGDYRALGSGAAVPGNLVVKFRPDTSEAEIRRTLLESGARFAGGPTASQAYVLAAPSGSMGEVLARLRASPGVTLAESLDAAEDAP